MEELWAIQRVAEYLGVSERTVYNRVRAGELPAIKVGRLWRVKPSDLEAWLDLGVAAEQRADYGPAASVHGPYPYESTVAVQGVAETGRVPSRQALEEAVGASDDLLVRRLSFVALLTRGVEALGWSAPVVVGGHAVEFYTAGDYPTQDIDLAAASEPVAQVLDGWGFERQGRHWYDAPLGIVVEVPGGPLSPGERAHVVSVEVAGAIAYVLGIEDLIIDRLAACKHWADQESCRWARVLAKGALDLDHRYLAERAREEDVADVLAGLGIGGHPNGGQGEEW